MQETDRPVRPQTLPATPAGSGPRNAGAVAKRVFDFVAALFVLVLIAPLLALIAVLVKATSAGPVIYRGRRIGRNGSEFQILKFRTMVPNAEALGGSATAADDPRLTRIGKFLRRYKFDELPQFINVLTGDMSLVGPRPEVCKYIDWYAGDRRRILQLRPGITDWASIWNSDEGSVLAGSRDPERVYEQSILPRKIALQLYYLNQWSFVSDLKILVYTLVRLCWKEWLPEAIARLEERPAPAPPVPVGVPEKFPAR